MSANRLTMENVDWFVVNKFHSEMQSPKAMCIVLSSVSKNYFHFIPEFFIYYDQCSAGTRESDRVRGRQANAETMIFAEIEEEEEESE